jgi:transcriptional regulator with XRE-family HTH domain
MPKTPTLGQRIKAARKASGIKQRAIAREFDVDHTTVFRWERDQSFPGMERLDRMAELFKCSRAYLVLGEGAAPKSAVVS